MVADALHLASAHTIIVYKTCDMPHTPVYISLMKLGLFKAGDRGAVELALWYTMLQHCSAAKELF